EPPAPVSGDDLEATVARLHHERTDFDDLPSRPPRACLPELEVEIAGIERLKDCAMDGVAREHRLQIGLRHVESTRAVQRVDVGKRRDRNWRQVEVAAGVELAEDHCEFAAACSFGAG